MGNSCTCIPVNSTAELGLSQMREKGLEAVCKRSLQLFREGPVVPEAEESASCPGSQHRGKATEDKMYSVINPNIV